MANAILKLKSSEVEKLKSSKTFQPFNHSTFRLEKAVRAQGGAVVKPHQVKAMVIAARRAYAEQSKLGLVDDGVDFDAWRAATLHDIVGAAAPSSFRAVTQRDYAAVVAYFEELAGEDRLKSSEVEKLKSSKPFNSSTFQPFNSSTVQHREADEERRALWALTLVEGEVADAFGGREGAARYADSLFEKIHRTVRFAATAKQIWAVIFTLRKRAHARLKSSEVEKLKSSKPFNSSTFQPFNSSTFQPEISAKTALGARGASGVSLDAPGPSKRFPAFSRAL